MAPCFFYPVIVRGFFNPHRYILFIRACAEWRAIPSSALPEDQVHVVRSTIIHQRNSGRLGASCRPARRKRLHG